MVLQYIRNKHASACDLDEETVITRACIEDTFFAATVEMRLGLLKAFVRFLIERNIVRPEVLSRRLFVKVTDALTREMDSDDVKRLL